MKPTIRRIFLMLGIVMALVFCTASVSAAGSARTAPGPDERISLYGDESLFIVDPQGPITTVPGVTYNKGTNTLTMENVDMPNYVLDIMDAGDIKLVLKGTVKLSGIRCGVFNNNNNLKATLSISGSGNLIMKTKGNSGKYSGFIWVFGPSAKLSVAKATGLDLRDSSTALSVCPSGSKKKCNTKKLLKIKGKHSKGKLVYVQYAAGENIYYWNKKTFTKPGTNNAPADPSLKPAKGEITGTEVGYYGENSVAIWWKRLDKNCVGYQTDYCTRKDFPSKKFFRMTIEGQDYTGSGATNLPKGNIYIRVRGYNKVGGKTYYGPWSDVVKVYIN